MSSNNAFAFKLDPASLPQLSSRGDNYAKWRAAWTIAFRFAELWNVIDGKPPTVERLSTIVSMLSGKVDRKNDPLTDSDENTVWRFFASSCCEVEHRRSN